ncbi:hypothetical protein PRIPAC_96944, partial [Pristionchus pacificus]|uniref:Uncharacterized protein n=1 Tax=Pristionchus pacificus TaxID=54126 RepID=A0A2A6CUC7_PRIPA
GCSKGRSFTGTLAGRNCATILIAKATALHLDANSSALKRLDSQEEASDAPHSIDLNGLYEDYLDIDGFQVESTTNCEVDQRARSYAHSQPRPFYSLLDFFREQALKAINNDELVSIVEHGKCEALFLSHCFNGRC